MGTEVLLPVLIALFAAALITAVHFRTRPQPDRRDLALPDQLPRQRDSAAAVGSTPASTPPSGLDLVAWHRAHEATLIDFVECTDDLANGHDPEIEPSEVGFEEAMVAHPSPEMRAELAALRAAAVSMANALDRDDLATARRQRGVYADYRDPWVERLRQFAGDPARIAALDRALPPAQEQMFPDSPGGGPGVDVLDDDADIDTAAPTTDGDGIDGDVASGDVSAV